MNSGSSSHRVELLKAESSFGWMSGMPSGNVITFFEGSIDAAAQELRVRLRAVVEANPWLCSRLTKSPDRNGIAMTWTDADVTRELFAIEQGESTLFHVSPKDLRGVFRIDQPYEELCRAVTQSRLAVPVGKQCLKHQRPLVALVLSPINENQFALWISMSHIIADGYTAYTILGMMLSSDPAAIASLAVERDHSFDPKLRAAIGHQEKAMLDFSLPGILNALGNHFFSPRPRALCFRLNPDAVDTVKHTYQNEAAGMSGAPSYISANDIVTSELGRLLQFSSLYMAMNFRGRFPLNPYSAEGEDFGLKMAGNYESGIFFFGGDFDHPSQIRKAQGLATPGLFQRSPNENGLISSIPGFWRRTFGKPGLVTNWSGWKAEFQLPGCSTLLHLPITELDRPFFESAIIFQARPGDIGVLIFSRVVRSMEHVQAFSPIFGDAISHDLFPDGRAS